MSGYEEEQVGNKLSTTPNQNISWLPHDEFLLKAEKCDANSSEVKFLWLYRSPWSSLLNIQDSKQTTDNPLQNWTTWQQRILKIKHTLLPLQLINIEHTNIISFDNVSIPVDLDKANSPLLPIIKVTMSKLFEWIAPEQWDVFEALELAAINNDGKPSCRHNLTRPLPSSLYDISVVLTKGLRLDTLEEYYRDQYQKQEHELKSSVQAISAVNNENNHRYSSLLKKFSSLEEENKLLLNQLTLVQEELERYFLYNQTLANSLEKSKETMNKARRFILM